MGEKLEIQDLLPAEIEKKSFEIITQEIGQVKLDPLEAPILKRVIHTSADFDYLENLFFSHGAVERGMNALLSGATIVTDTKMVQSGINKAAVEKLGCRVVCFIGDDDVKEKALKDGTTRSAVSMQKASLLKGPLIFAIGNAPTALLQLDKLIRKGCMEPELIIGVPVGFVNVVESKERILQLNTPHIVAKGRKGGSNIAAAICNGLLYQCGGRKPIE